MTAHCPTCGGIVRVPESRKVAVYTVVCAGCGKQIESEVNTGKCSCGAYFRLEWQGKPKGGDAY